MAYSPVRGKHARMLEDLRKYTKFIGATIRRLRPRLQRISSRSA